MLVLALARVAHAAPLGLEVDAAFTYAYAPPTTGLGVLARTTVLVNVWDKPRATGSIDLGVELGYQNQSYVFLAPYLGAAEKLDGADHRVNVWLAAGHTVHVLKSRHLSFGVSALGGLTHFASNGQFSNSREAIMGSFATGNDIFALAVRVSIGYRFSRYFGVRAHVDAFPLPEQWSSTGVFSAGLGLFAAIL